MIRRRPCSLALCCVVCLSVGRAGEARAADPRLVVHAEACPELDANEVALLLELELREAVAAWGDLRTPPVILACRGERVHISVDDPLTGKRLQREVPQSSSSEGRERGLALAVSQLFLTSWLELLLPAEARAPMPERPPSEVSAATARAKRAVLPALEAELQPTAAATSGLGARLSLMGGLALRDLGEPFGTAQVGVRAGVELRDRLHVFSQAALERGAADRQRGSIESQLAEVGVGLGWRALSVPPFGLEAGLIFSALYVRLEGRPGVEGVRAGRSASAAAQIALEAGPTVDLEPFRLGLSAFGGVTLFAPEGTVTSEPSVTPSGPFVGLRLSIGLVLDPSPSAFLSRSRTSAATTGGNDALE